MPIFDVFSNGHQLLRTDVLDAFHHHGLVELQPGESRYCGFVRVWEEMRIFGTGSLYTTLEVVIVRMDLFVEVGTLNEIKLRIRLPRGYGSRLLPFRDGGQCQGCASTHQHVGS